VAKVRERVIERPDAVSGVVLAVARAAWVALAVMVALTGR
jgi:hypothetical protein